MAVAAAIPLFFCLFVLCLEKSKATYGILECKVTYAGKNRKATYRIGKPEVTYAGKCKATFQICIPEITHAFSADSDRAKISRKDHHCVPGKSATVSDIWDSRAQGHQCCEKRKAIYGIRERKVTNVV